MAPHATIRGAAGANRALGLILMLLTPILSASPLAVPKVARSTADTPRQQQQLEAFGATTATTITSIIGHTPIPILTTANRQPHLLKKITNWAEKPPDPPPNLPAQSLPPSHSSLSSVRVSSSSSLSSISPSSPSLPIVQHVLKRTETIKDLYYLIPSANLYKHSSATSGATVGDVLTEDITHRHNHHQAYGQQQSQSQPQQQTQQNVPPTLTTPPNTTTGGDQYQNQQGAFNTSTDAKNVYFGKSFINHSLTVSATPVVTNVAALAVAQASAPVPAPATSIATHTMNEHNTTEQVFYSNANHHNINVKTKYISSSSSSSSTSSINSNSDLGVSYFNDASVLEAKRYRELLQQKLFHKQNQLQRLQVSPQLTAQNVPASGTSSTSSNYSGSTGLVNNSTIDASGHILIHNISNNDNYNNVKIINSDGADQIVKSNDYFTHSSESAKDSFEISNSVKIAGKFVWP